MTVLTVLNALPRNPDKLAYWIMVAVVSVAATTGLKPLFVPELGPVFGLLLAGLVALAIELLFSRSLLEWRRTKNIMGMVFVVLLGSVSIMCDMPLIFRMVNGAHLTTQQFTDQQGTAVRDVIVARERLVAAAEAARALAVYSQQKAQREDAAGDTCEKSSGGKGVRYQFRMADAEDFQQIDQAIATRSQRLNVTVAEIQAVPAETGEALRQGLAKLNASLAAAFGIVHDPALAGMAERLEARAQSDDTARKGRSGETFRCPDPTIRDRARATAAQLRALPDLKQRPVVADFTDANTVMTELPTRIVASFGRGGDKSNALSGRDAVAIAFSLMFELLLVVATWRLPHEPEIGQRLRSAQRALGNAPTGDISTFMHMLSDPDPALSRLFTLINRYRLRLWWKEFLVVGHGTNDSQLEELSRTMSVLCAIGWARRYRTLVMPHLVLIAWWRWPEMRRALYREVYRIDIRALDELNLAELLARTRGTRERREADAHPWQAAYPERLTALPAE